MTTARGWLELVSWSGVVTSGLAVWFASAVPTPAQHALAQGTLVPPPVAAMTPDQLTAWVLAICGAVSAVINLASGVIRRWEKWRSGRPTKHRSKPHGTPAVKGAPQQQREKSS